MVDEKRQPTSRHRGIVCILGTFAAGLCMMLTGCAGAATGPAPTDQPVPTAVEAPPHDTPTLEATPTPGAMQAAPQPTPTPFVPFGGPHTMPAPEFYGAASAPLEKRIYVSDVIVKAKLVSVEAPDQQDLIRRIFEATNNAEHESLVSQFPLPTILTFKALEYVKGSGPDEFTVGIKDPNNNRDDTWDNQEALLFLNTAAEAGATEPGGSDGAAAQSADSPAGTYAFASSYGLNNDVYTIESVNPVWLPAGRQGQAQADGAGSGSGGDGIPAMARFATEWDRDTGQPTHFMTLPEIKKTITWVKGDGTREYDHCVGQAINYLVWNRDWEAHYGEPMTPGHHEAEIASGKGAGIIIDEGSEFSSSQYHRFWLTGEDAELFQAIHADDDKDPSTGYRETVVTARPLPVGQYGFSDHGVLPWYEPCDFNGEGQLDWTVTAVAPAGAMHEAFFDPVAIGQGVGANASNGVLQPAAIATEGYATTIKSLVWQDKKVIMTLSPHVSLLGQTLDFIVLDGTVALSLEAKSATVDASAGTYTWSRETRPWNAGDMLMLRLHGPTVSVADASGPEGGEILFKVTLSETVKHEVRVKWENGFAHDAEHPALHGTEFLGQRGWVTFAPGDTEKEAELYLNQDTEAEPDESFVVKLSQPSGATIARGVATMTIIDDD